MAKQLLLAALVISSVSSALAQQDRTLCSIISDLDGDNRPETVSITCRTIENGHPVGGEIIVSSGSGSALWRQPKMNPWKLQVGDVDGDSRPEVVVGVWKTSPKDPVMARRAFVYSWNGRRLLPKWLGSRLSRRFDDFTLADINRDGCDELISLEVAPMSLHRVAVYRWRSFGFEWLGCTPDAPGLVSLSSDGTRAAVSTLRGPSVVRIVNGIVTLLKGGNTQ